MDQTALNMQMAVAAKVAAETKCQQLAEQKKMLVKEVKGDRKQIDDLKSDILTLRTMNASLHARLEVGVAAGGRAVTPSHVISPVHPPHNTALDSDDEIDSTQQEPAHSSLTIASHTPSAASHTGATSTTSSRHPSVTGYEEPRDSPPAKHSYLSNMFGNTTTIKNNAQPAISMDDDMFRQSLDGTDAAGIADAAAVNHHPAFVHDNPVSSPAEIKLRCLRCQGTVEGPKYSTCKCAIPALCHDDLEHGDTHTSAGTVGSIFKATGSIMSSIGRRASLMGSGNNADAAGHDLSAPTPAPTTTTNSHSKRSSISGMFGFGSSNE